jgi:hypothetical protein
MKVRMVLLVLFFAVAGLAAPAPIHVTLTIDPATTLPGLSVPLALRIENSGAPIHLAPGIRVRVTSQSGESFVAAWAQDRDFGLLELGTEEDDPRIIGRGETVELVAPAVDLESPSWALDPQLLVSPATWEVEVLIYDSRGDGKTPLAVSSPASLSIVRPAPREEEIWEAILRSETRGIAERISVEQPGSRYFPYLAPLVARRAPAEKAALLERTIALHPTTPVLPWLRFATAHFYTYESRRAFDVEHDLQKAVAWSNKAREELLRLEKHPDAWSKMKAREALDDLPDRAAFELEAKIIRDKGKP